MDPDRKNKIGSKRDQHDESSKEGPAQARDVVDIKVEGKINDQVAFNKVLDVEISTNYIDGRGPPPKGDGLQPYLAFVLLQKNMQHQSDCRLLTLRQAVCIQECITHFRTNQIV